MSPARLLLAQLRHAGRLFDLGGDGVLQRARGRRQRNFFRSSGKLRPADANALTRLDLDLQPRDRPVAPVGYRLFEQGRDDTQGRFSFFVASTGLSHVGLQRLHAAAHEGAAPQANRVLAQ